MATDALTVKVGKSQTRFKRVRNPLGSDVGLGNFFLLLDVTASGKAVYIPISIASSKKPTGFVYQIEGTGKGTIVTTDISCQGKDMTQVTLGTLLYAKIPAGKTATFRILIETKGQIGKEYKVKIHQINYKFDPTDARYGKYEKPVSSKMLKFK